MSKKNSNRPNTHKNGGMKQAIQKSIKSDFVVVLLLFIVSIDVGVIAYDCVCVETLDLKTMSQKFRFGKSVHDNAFSMFVTLLKYKIEDQGKRLIKIDKMFPSSKLCSRCGYVKEKLELSERTYTCKHCGLEIDRDYNASLNIQTEGMRLILS